MFKKGLFQRITIIFSMGIMLGIIFFIGLQAVRGDEGDVITNTEVSEATEVSATELITEATQMPTAEVTQTPSMEVMQEPTIEPTMDTSPSGKIMWKIETRQMLKNENPLYSQPEQTVQGEGDSERLKRALFPIDGGNYLIKGVSPMLTLNGNINKGKIIHVRLESNPSTGYQWEVIGLDQSILKKVDETFINNARPLIGAPQTQQFTFEGVQDANAEIKFIYHRLFEPKKETTHRVTIQADLLEQIQDLTNPNRQTYLNTLPEKTNPPLEVRNPLGLPSSFDLGELGKVTSVKDQGYCGSCWAFAATSAMESALMVQNGLGAINLSEQYLLSCNNDGMNCYYGGWDDYAQDYHKKNGYKRSNQIEAGAVLESVFPYADYYNQSSTSPACATNYQKSYWLQYSPRESWYVAGNWYTMPTVEQIKNAIYTYGALSVSVCVDSTWGSYPSSGWIYTGSPSCTTTNHAVNLVGWDDANQYWILKNSWGTSWGYGGYMFIRWGVNKVGLSANYVITYQTPTPTATYTPTITPTPTYTPTPPLPPSPRLIAPKGTVTSTDSPAYQWAEVPGAIEYYLEVYKSSSVIPLSTSVSTTYCSGGVCTYPGVKLVSGTYQFRVKTRNQTGWGSYGAWQVFVVSSQSSLPSPTLIGPNGVLQTNLPTFQWNKVNGAEYYDLMVTSTINGAVQIYQRVSSNTNCSGNVCSMAAITPLYKGTYSFRVRSVNDQGRADKYSNPMYFWVNIHSITAPQNLLVEQTNTPRPLLKWEKVAGAIRYYLLVYQDNTGTYPLRSYVYTSACSDQICTYRAAKDLTQGNYRFKVRAYNGKEWSAYSDWKAFTLQ